MTPGASEIAMYSPRIAFCSSSERLSNASGAELEWIRSMYFIASSFAEYGRPWDERAGPNSTAEARKLEQSQGSRSPSATVLVTGGSGFVGGWCLVELLRRGYRVRATVR